MNLLALSVFCFYVAMPVAIMGSTAAPNWIFLGLLSVSLAYLLKQPRDQIRLILSRYKILLLAYLVPVLAVSVSMVAHAHWAGADFQRAITLSAGLPVLLTTLCQIQRQGSLSLAPCLWGIYPAAIGSAAYVGWIAFPTFARPYTQIYNIISYSNLMLLLATLSLFSIGWRLSRWRRLEAAAKALVAVIAFTGFILTQTRTGWLAVPAFALLGTALMGRFKNPWRSLSLAAGISVLALVIGLGSSGLRDRFQGTVSQITSCHGDGAMANNNVCARIQLWRAALDMFAKHPVIGLGDGRRYAQKLKAESLPEGIVSKQVARTLVQPHNDMLYSLASFGVPGALGLLLAYLAPLCLFLKRFRGGSGQRASTTAAVLGAVLCTGFIFMGLTELMLEFPRTLAFFVMFVALFIAASEPEPASRRPGTP